MKYCWECDFYRLCGYSDVILKVLGHDKVCTFKLSEGFTCDYECHWEKS